MTNPPKWQAPLVSFLVVVASGTALFLTCSIVLAWLSAPVLPAIQGDKAGSVDLETYRQVVNIHQERHREIFQLVTINTLLPLLTAVGGYVFGIQQKRDLPGTSVQRRNPDQVDQKEGEGEIQEFQGRRNQSSAPDQMLGTSEG